MYSFWYLKEEFLKYGFNLSTQDINSIEIVIYNEMPSILPLEKNRI